MTDIERCAAKIEPPRPDLAIRIGELHHAAVKRRPPLGQQPPRHSHVEEHARRMARMALIERGFPENGEARCFLQQPDGDRLAIEADHVDRDPVILRQPAHHIAHIGGIMRMVGQGAALAAFPAARLKRDECA